MTKKTPPPKICASSYIIQRTRPTTPAHQGRNKYSWGTYAMWEVRWIAKRHHHRARVAATVFAGRNPGFRFMSWPASVEGIPGYCFQRINAGQRPKIGTPRSPRQPTPQYLRINPGK